jgi:hypothetical protein
MRSIFNSWIANMRDDRKERTGCQEATEANPKKMQPNPGEKEAVVERQEIPNQKTAVHSMTTCRRGHAVA